MRGPRLSPTHRHRPGRSRPGAVLVSAAIVAACAFVLPVSGSATTSCWQRVIADWSVNGRIDRVYPLGCYRQAVKRLPEDLRAYSSAPEDIHRALTERRSLQSHAQTQAAALPVAAPRPAAGGNALTVVLSGLAGLLVAAGLAVWLLRGRTRDPGSGDR